MPQLLNQPTNQHELEKLAMPVVQIRMINAGVWRTCVNCEHWDNEASTPGPNYKPAGCKMAGGAVPPPNVIVLGCEQWEYIPF